MSRVDLAPRSSPYTLMRLFLSFPLVPRKIYCPSIPPRRTRGEPEHSSVENPRRYKDVLPPLYLMPYHLTSPGNFVYTNHCRPKRLDASTTTPRPINWALPKETRAQFQDCTAEDLLLEAVNPLLQKLHSNFTDGFDEICQEFDDFSFRFYLSSILGWPTDVIDFVETFASQTNQFSLSVTEIVMECMDSSTKEWSAIANGMSRLPLAVVHLVGNENIALNARVTGIRNEANGKVTPSIAGCNGPVQATFDKVIMAIPPPALELIPSRPAWSERKECTIRSMHFESLYKMGLHFSTRFWERVGSMACRGGLSTTDLQIRWIVYPSNGIDDEGQGVLLVYSWMADADAWLPLTLEERRDLVLANLVKIYNGKIDTMNSHCIINVYDFFMEASDAVWSARNSTRELPVAKEHEPNANDGFPSDTTRTGRLLSNRNHDDNKLFRSLRPRRVTPEPEPYSRGRFSSKVDPPLPLRRIIDRSDSNSRFRPGRMELIPHSYSPQAVSPIITLAFSNLTSDFLRRVSYWQGGWYVMENASAASQLMLGVPNSLPPLDFCVGATQGTVVPQRRWAVPFEGKFCRHADGTTLLPPIFFVNWNSGLGFWLEDILQDRSREPCEQDKETPLERSATTYVRISVRSLQPAEILIHACQHPSQWPDYRHWTHGITTRDLTSARNPIRLVCLMNCVGTSVEGFLNVNVRFSLRHHRH